MTQRKNLRLNIKGFVVTEDNKPQGACPGCELPFVEGELATVYPIGPGHDPDARERARTGRHFTARAIVLHWACATGIEE